MKTPLTQAPPVEIIEPGNFEPHLHWYPKALNATIHPMINFFMNMDRNRIIKRYCHLHPMVKAEKLEEILSEKPRYFHWSGADLINVTSAGGRRQMVVIETNSCPSGQKSMPLLDDNKEQGGYRRLIDQTFKQFISSKRMPIEGALAVIYDKNYMENSGYASCLADVMNEPVYLAEMNLNTKTPVCVFEDGILKIKDPNGNWIQIRAAFRYVTQKPWTRIPLNSKTRILNPIIACLSGGRNKLVAAKAYDFFNAEIEGTGLKIISPDTIWDVSKQEIPLWVKKMGGHAVVKVPYSNAGQGVFTIVNDRELENFMKKDFEYEQFIVQSMIGNYNWSSSGKSGKLYHVGTMPGLKGETYVSDIRMMVSSTSEGIRPLSIYARRAPDPLEDLLASGVNSWSMLGTNLSYHRPDGVWDTDTNRLMLMDRKDFNKLGLSLDDLIEAYIQTVLSTLAIDRMAQTLVNSKGRFSMKLFKSINVDQALINEILID